MSQRPRGGFRLRPQSSATRVKPGDEITRGKRAGIAEEEHGTAGVFVARDSDGARGFLTCAHVLQGPSSDPKMKPVYSPHYKTVSDCECNDPVGDVDPATLFVIGHPTDPLPSLITIDQIDFATDTSVALLRPKITARNEIPEIGPIGAVVRDLIGEHFALFPKNGEPSNQENKEAAEALPQFVTLPAPIHVRKYGASTGLTTGVIKRFVRLPVRRLGTAKVTHAWDAAWAIEVEADPTSRPFDHPYELDLARHNYVENLDTTQLVAAGFTATPATTTVTAINAAEVRVKGALFSEVGDSGSALVDGAGQIVGIVRGGVVFRAQLFVAGRDAPLEIATGYSHAVFIRAALTELGYHLLPSTAWTSGERVAVPGMSITPERPPPAFDEDAVRRAYAALERTPRGARLIALARRHVDEVRRLVHHRRRVTVTWHRHKGPAFVAALMRSSNEPAWPIPAAIAGVSLADALRVMRDVLSAEGSDELQSVIRDHEHEILELATAPSIGAALTRLADEASA